MKLLKDKVVAVLVAEGINDYLLNITKNALEDQGASIRMIGLKPGKIIAAQHQMVPLDYTVYSVTEESFDALYIPGGKKSIENLWKHPKVLDFVCSFYTSGKNIAMDDDGILLLEKSCLNKKMSEYSHEQLKSIGIFIHTHSIPSVKSFIKAIAKDIRMNDLKTIYHREWMALSA